MGMGSRAALFVRATPPLISFRRSAALVQNKRFYTAKSSLEPPNVARLAETARISLNPQQVEEFAPKIRQVIDWFGQLQAVDLQSIEPAIRADTEGDNLRSDVPEIFDNRDAIISAVPTFEDSYIKVPKVLNKEAAVTKEIFRDGELSAGYGTKMSRLRFYNMYVKPPYPSGDAVVHNGHPSGMWKLFRP